MKRIGKLFEIHEALSEIMIDLTERFNSKYTSKEDKLVSRQIESVLIELRTLIDLAEQRQFRLYYNHNASKDSTRIEVIRNYLKETRLDISESVLTKRVTRGIKNQTLKAISRRSP